MTTVIDSPNQISPRRASAPSATRRSERRRRSLSSRIYWPALSIVAIAVVFIAIGVVESLGRHQFRRVDHESTRDRRRSG